MKSEIDQMVNQVLYNFFYKSPEFKSFNREKQIFEMNPGQDLNYHAETHIRYTLIIWVIKGDR